MSSCLIGKNISLGQSFNCFGEAKNYLSNIGNVCLFSPLLFVKTSTKFVLEIYPFPFFREIWCTLNTFDIFFWTMNGWLGYVVHSVYITLGLFKIYYRINFPDNMDNIVPYVWKTWWTHLENPMALWLLVINALNLDLEWTD